MNRTLIFKRAVLSTHDSNSNDITLTYHVAQKPKHGRLINLDQPEVEIESFNQLDLVGNKIVYFHATKEEERSDTFEFSVNDGHNFLFRTFRITITNVDNKLPVVQSRVEILDRKKGRDSKQTD